MRGPIVPRQSGRLMVSVNAENMMLKLMEMRSR
jgi:hypothetical protein